jgi:site-specific DNA-methyltransferase (adenine-specific)
MSSAAEFKQRNVGASYRPDWETPPELFAKIDAEFGFTMDVAASSLNTKCEWFMVDGLDQSWGRNVCWCNPPYDRALAKWVAKASEEASQGATVVMLIPARTDTRWWHQYVEGRAEVRFIKGRIRFVGAPYNAPFPSCLVVFRPSLPVQP